MYKIIGVYPFDDLNETLCTQLNDNITILHEYCVLLSVSFYVILTYLKFHIHENNKSELHNEPAAMSKQSVYIPMAKPPVLNPQPQSMPDFSSISFYLNGIFWRNVL